MREVRRPQERKDMIGSSIDWSLCDGYVVLGARHEFKDLRHLLGWLARWGYDGHDKVTDVLARSPSEDGPVLRLVPKTVVDRWMGVA